MTGMRILNNTENKFHNIETEVCIYACTCIHVYVHVCVWKRITFSIFEGLIILYNIYI